MESALKFLQNRIQSRLAINSSGEEWLDDMRTKNKDCLTSIVKLAINLYMMQSPRNHGSFCKYMYCQQVAFTVALRLLFDGLGIQALIAASPPFIPLNGNLYNCAQTSQIRQRHSQRTLSLRLDRLLDPGDSLSHIGPY